MTIEFSSTASVEVPLPCEEPPSPPPPVPHLWLEDSGNEQVEDGISAGSAPSTVMTRLTSEDCSSSPFRTRPRPVPLICGMPLKLPRRPPRVRLCPCSRSPSLLPLTSALGIQFIEARAYSGFVEGWFCGTHEEGLGYKPPPDVAAPCRNPVFLSLAAPSEGPSLDLGHWQEVAK